MKNEKWKIISTSCLRVTKNVVSFQRGLGHYDICSAPWTPTNVNAYTIIDSYGGKLTFSQTININVFKKTFLTTKYQADNIKYASIFYTICVITSFSWRGTPDLIQCYVAEFAIFHLGNDLRSFNIGWGTGVRGDERQCFSCISFTFWNTAALKYRHAFRKIYMIATFSKFWEWHAVVERFPYWLFTNFVKFYIFHYPISKSTISQTTTVRNTGWGTGVHCKNRSVPDWVQAIFSVPHKHMLKKTSKYSQT